MPRPLFTRNDTPSTDEYARDLEIYRHSAQAQANVCSWLETTNAVHSPVPAASWLNEREPFKRCSAPSPSSASMSSIPPGVTHQPSGLKYVSQLRYEEYKASLKNKASAHYHGQKRSQAESSVSPVAYRRDRHFSVDVQIDDSVISDGSLFATRRRGASTNSVEDQSVSSSQIRDTKVAKYLYDLRTPSDCSIAKGQCHSVSTSAEETSNSEGYLCPDRNPFWNVADKLGHTGNGKAKNSQLDLGLVVKFLDLVKNTDLSEADRGQIEDMWAQLDEAYWAVRQYVGKGGEDAGKSKRKQDESNTTVRGESCERNFGEGRAPIFP